MDNKFRAEMRRLGITVAWLAAYLDLSTSGVHPWHSGRKPPPPWIMRVLELLSTLDAAGIPRFRFPPEQEAALLRRPGGPLTTQPRDDLVGETQDMTYEQIAAIRHIDERGARELSRRRRWPRRRTDEGMIVTVPLAELHFRKRRGPPAWELERRRRLAESSKRPSPAAEA